MRVCILGANLDVGNMGVRALGVSLLTGFVSKLPDCRISFVFGGRKSGCRLLYSCGEQRKVRVVHYRLSARSGLGHNLFWILLLALISRLLPDRSARALLIRSPILEEFSSADLVADIRGGDSFSDIYGFRKFVLGCLPAISAILCRRPLMLLPQTFGPFNSWLSTKIAAWIIQRASYVVARDRDSQRLAQGLLDRKGLASECVLCPDVAFLLESREPKNLAIEPELPSRIESLIGFNVSGLLYNGGYTGRNQFRLRTDYRRLVHRAIERLLEGGATVLLIPHCLGSESEETAAKEIYECFAGRQVHLLTGQYDQSELKWVIGRCSFFVGSRMHACIAAISQMVPTIGLAYSRKFRGVFETVGLDAAAVDLTHLAAPEALSHLSSAYEEREKTRQFLKESVPLARTRVDRMFERLSQAGLLQNRDLHSLGTGIPLMSPFPNPGGKREH